MPGGKVKLAELKTLINKILSHKNGRTEYAALRTAGVDPLASTLESHCFLYLMLTVGLATALGVTALLVTIYCLYRCKSGGRHHKSTDSVSAPVAQQPSNSPLDALMELQVLDALSRSVRQKKNSVHEEIIKLYSAPEQPAQSGNVYSAEPRPSVKQIKRQNAKAGGGNVTTVRVGRDSARPSDQQSLYWEIGQHHQILPPTPV